MNMDEKKKLQSSLSNGSADKQEEDAAQGEPISRCLSCLPFPSYRLIGIVISYFILSGFFFGMGILYHQQNAVQCILVTCPPDWIGYEGHCYKFSKEEKTQNESQNICRLHNAFLANITKEEMDFVTKFTRDHIFWIGLIKEANQPWKWQDGENATLEVIGNGGNCAYLNDDGTASSGTCSNTHHYICKKKMIL